MTGKMLASWCMTCRHTLLETWHLPEIQTKKRAGFPMP